TVFMMMRAMGQGLSYELSILELITEGLRKLSHEGVLFHKPEQEFTHLIGRVERKELGSGPRSLFFRDLAERAPTKRGPCPFIASLSTGCGRGSFAFAGYRRPHGARARESGHAGILHEILGHDLHLLFSIARQY